MTATKNNSDNTRINRTKITTKQKWGEKPTGRTFQATKKRTLTRESLDMAKKRKL